MIINELAQPEDVIITRVNTAIDTYALDNRLTSSLKDIARKIVSGVAPSRTGPPNAINAGNGMGNRPARAAFVARFNATRGANLIAYGTTVLHILEDEMESDISGAKSQRGSPELKTANIGASADLLADLGHMRFDTVLVRNLLFVINLYRSARLKLQRDLTYSKDVIARSAPITRPQLTEFFGNQSWARREYGSSNRF